MKQDYSAMSPTVTTEPEHFAQTGWRIVTALKPKETAMETPTTGDAAKGAANIRTKGKTLDYEQAALDALARSYEVPDDTISALLTAEAHVWALLHLARVSA